VRTTRHHAATPARPSQHRSGVLRWPPLPGGAPRGPTEVPQSACRCPCSALLARRGARLDHRRGRGLLGSGRGGKRRSASGSGPVMVAVSAAREPSEHGRRSPPGRARTEVDQPRPGSGHGDHGGSGACQQPGLDGGAHPAGRPRRGHDWLPVGDLGPRTLEPRDFWRRSGIRAGVPDRRDHGVGRPHGHTPGRTAPPGRRSATRSEPCAYVACRPSDTELNPHGPKGRRGFNRFWRRHLRSMP
jgi:hypothetical protein